MKITEKQWKWINDVTLRIHATYDMTEMRRELLSVLGALIPFDKATSYIQDGENPYGNPVTFNLSEEDVGLYVEKYSEIDPFIPMMGMFAEINTPIRASDYAITTAIENTDYYKTVWEPKDIRHSLMFPLAQNGIWLGSFTLFRDSDKEDFTDDEMEMANIIMQHLQVRFWKEKCIADEIRMLGATQKSEKRLISEYGLTERECEVVSLTTRGLTDAEICDGLAISKNTLKKHISNIYGKLDISTRVELLKIIGK